MPDIECRPVQSSTVIHDVIAEIGMRPYIVSLSIVVDVVAVLPKYTA